MVKKVKFKTGDIFSVAVSEAEFVFGRIIFDVAKQYIDRKMSNKRNYLDWFGDCILIETFFGVHQSIESVDFRKKAVTGQFISAKKIKNSDWTIVGFKEIAPEEVSFPETLASIHPHYYFMVGELSFLTSISSEEADLIKVFPSYGSGFWEIVATIDYSGREDLIKEDKRSAYFLDCDLKSHPEKRGKIYAMIGESPKQTYYEMSLKHGFDLARLYL